MPHTFKMHDWDGNEYKDKGLIEGITTPREHCENGCVDCRQPYEACSCSCHEREQDTSSPPTRNISDEQHKKEIEHLVKITGEVNITGEPDMSEVVDGRCEKCGLNDLLKEITTENKVRITCSECGENQPPRWEDEYWKNADSGIDNYGTFCAIRNFIRDLLQKERAEIEKMVEGKRRNEVSTSRKVWKRGYNQALDDLLTKLRARK